MDYYLKYVVTLNVVFGLVNDIAFANTRDNSTYSSGEVAAGVSDCMSTSEPSNYAVIPYSTGGALSQFYETKKIYKVPTIKKSIVIKQDWIHNGVAGVVWEAANILSEYIAKNLSMKNKTVLELGAGTGLVGMTAAALGANVTCTDVAKALPLLQENIDLNFSKEAKQHLSVQRLEWGKDHTNFAHCFFDYIVGADIIYLEETFDSLLQTITHLSNCKEENENFTGTKIYLSAKHRYERVDNFVTKLRDSFSSVNAVYEDDRVNVVIYECF